MIDTIMININELSLLNEFKYLHLSDKISKGEANLDGTWIRYYDDCSFQMVNFNNYILKSDTTIYGDSNIIYQKDRTIFINEQSKDLFKTNGDIIGYLYDIENRWRIIKKNGDKDLPYNTWNKELNQFVLFAMFCLFTIIGGTTNWQTGVISAVIVGLSIWGIGHYVLFEKQKDYVKEYIKNHEYDDYSRILIHEYLSEDNIKLRLQELFNSVFKV